MTRLFASLLVALALFVSPLVMKGGSAMAMTGPAMADGGCAESQHSLPDDQKSGMKMNCAIACAAIPTTPSTMTGQLLPLPPKAVSTALHSLTGIWPEGETPPPRIAPEI